MIELLILYELSRKVFTMYGIFREIRTKLQVLTTPSFGTIKPALTRLESNGFIKSQKTMSTGGRRSTFYSITDEGKNELRKLLLSPVKENPNMFITTARVRLICAEVLDDSAQKELLKLLKLKAESIMFDTGNLIKSESLEFFKKMVFENLLCECKNLISLLEGIERAGKN